MQKVWLEAPHSWKNPWFYGKHTYKDDQKTLMNGSTFKLWGNVQLIVVVILTKEAKNNISAGDQNGNLKAMRHIILQMTQWTEYMEQLIDVITINSG